jgi:hypothetical protein
MNEYDTSIVLMNINELQKTEACMAAGKDSDHVDSYSS